MSTPALSDSRLANVGARALSEAWAGLATRFRIITRRARIRFAERDWRGMAADAGERLELYTGVSREIAGELTGLLSERVSDKQLWAGMKAVYSGLISERDDWEVAETFFNSVTRRIFTTVGVDPRIEFVDTDFDVPPTKARRSLYTTYEGAGPPPPSLSESFGGPFPRRSSPTFKATPPGRRGASRITSAPWEPCVRSIE